MRRAPRRVVVGALVGSLVVVAGVAAAVVPDRGAQRALHVVAPADHTDAISTTSTTASVSSTTASPAPVTAVVPSSPGLAATAPAVRPAQPGDLTGVLALSSTTLRVGESTPLTLTVTNTSDDRISLPVDQFVGRPLFVELSNAIGLVAGGFHDLPATLEPHETASLTGSIGPSERRLGAAQATVRMWTPVGLGLEDYRQRNDEPVPGIAPVDVAVVPPGWSAGQPLDPTLGTWQAHMSSDSPAVADDGTVLVRVNVRNLADDVAGTRGYGSLAIMCQTAKQGTATLVDHVVEPATLAPGASAEFSATFDLKDAQAHGVWYGPSLTLLRCSLGMKFDEQDDPYNFPAWSAENIASDTVVITVTHRAPSTTAKASADA